MYTYNLIVLFILHSVLQQLKRQFHEIRNSNFNDTNKVNSCIDEQRDEQRDDAATSIGVGIDDDSTIDKVPISPLLTVFSGHDITILPLLYALQANIIRNNGLGIDSDNSTLEEQAFFWPGYGKSILDSIPP